MKKATIGLLLLTGVLVSIEAFAASGSGIAQVATKLTSQLSAVSKLITAGAYVAGIAMVVGAIVKFKAHKDNPTQIPIGTPIALLFVGIALIWSPTVFLKGGESMFDSGTVALTSGIDKFSGATKSGK